MESAFYIPKLHEKLDRALVPNLLHLIDTHGLSNDAVEQRLVDALRIRHGRPVLNGDYATIDVKDPISWKSPFVGKVSGREEIVAILANWLRLP